MLTAEQKAEAQKKLKSLSQEKAAEEEAKIAIKKAIKSIQETIASLKDDPKKQIQILRNLSSQEIPNRILRLERINMLMGEVQEKMKNERDKFSREALLLIQEKSRLDGGIVEIKKTIVNIQKALKESVEEEVNKRKKIETDLEKSLDQIRNKIKQFETETEQFDKQNKQLQVKIDEIKEKLNGIEGNYKVKAEEKDEENRAQREQLTEKLKVLEIQVEKATELSKQYTTLEKKNFDNKIALYLKTKKFPEYFSSFQSSADTLNSCKQELFKGVQRLKQAEETIVECGKQAQSISNQFLAELAKQKEKEQKIEEKKKEKEEVRAQILVLQGKLKEKQG